jgi:hypothetical protein
MLGKNSTSASYLQSSQIYETAASKLLSNSITNRTKITANLSGTAAALQTEFPELQAVSITLPLIGNRPLVYVQAAQPSVIVQSVHGGSFALNTTGLVLARVGDVPAGIPLVVDQSGVTPQPGKRYLPGSTISFIQTMEYQLAAAQIPAAAFVLPTGQPYELDVRLEGKQFVVRSNLQADSLVQSGVIIGTLKHLGASLPGSYLDVRTPDRAYYK